MVYQHRPEIIADHSYYYSATKELCPLLAPGKDHS